MTYNIYSWCHLKCAINDIHILLIFHDSVFSGMKIRNTKAFVSSFFFFVEEASNTKISVSRAPIRARYYYISFQRLHPANISQAYAFVKLLTYEWNSILINPHASTTVMSNGSRFNIFNPFNYFSVAIV